MQKKEQKGNIVKKEPKPNLVVGLRPSTANTQGNNPKDRYGLAKVPFSLIPSTALVFLARGLGHGARKYGPFNWRVEAVQGRVYLEAALRHLELLLDGEDFDRDTGDHHGSFVLSTMAIYLDAMVQGKLIDNRALPGRTGDLVAYFNELPGQVRTRSELVEGFKALVPNGHLLKDSLGSESTVRETLEGNDVALTIVRNAGKRVARGYKIGNSLVITNLADRPTTKKRSVKRGSKREKTKKTRKS